MQVQQYKLLCNDVSGALPGQSVYLSNVSNMVIGFISATDSETYIEITLFDPVSSDNLPLTIYNTVSSVDYTSALSEILETAPAEIVDMWRELATGTHDVTIH